MKSFETKPHSTGCTFYLPSRSRFMPWSWLVFSEALADGTRLELRFTQIKVIVRGHHLNDLIPFLNPWELSSISEGGDPQENDQGNKVVVSRIDLEEHEEI